MFGVVLVLPFVFSAGKKKPVDEALADQPLKTIPLDTLASGVHTLSVQIPDSAAWTNIRKQWGNPGYIVAVRSSSKLRYLRCLDRQQLSVSLKNAGHPLMTQAAEGAPYGYSAECSHPGVRFEAAPGSVVTGQINRSGDLGSTSDDLIVAPFWDSGVKDHIMGSLLAQDLASIFNISAVVGAVLLVASLMLFRGNIHKRRTA